MKNRLRTLFPASIIASALVTTVAVTTPIADAAVLQSQPNARGLGTTPLPDSVINALNASPLVTCSNWQVFVPVVTNFNSWGWAATSSPYTFYFRDTSVGATKFCPAGGFSEETFTQNGTSRCLYASGTGIIEGNCANAQAKWDHIIIASGPYAGDAMIRSDYSPNDCIWYNETNNPAKLAACNSNNTSDIFF
jgi:hypothetical protein